MFAKDIYTEGLFVFNFLFYQKFKVFLIIFFTLLGMYKVFFFINYKESMFWDHI